MCWEPQLSQLKAVQLPHTQEQLCPVSEQGRGVIPLHCCKAIKPARTPWDALHSTNLSCYYCKTNLHPIS